MNIYTATKWERREAMARINEQIEALGHRITHNWAIYEEHPASQTDPDWWQKVGRPAAGKLDYAGVMQADLLIYWDHPEANGARWEAGMAAARGIPIWLVDYSNPVIFDVLPQVQIVWTWDEALDRLHAASF